MNPALAGLCADRRPMPTLLHNRICDVTMKMTRTLPNRRVLFRSARIGSLALES